MFYGQGLSSVVQRLPHDCKVDPYYKKKKKKKNVDIFYMEAVSTRQSFVNYSI